MLKEAEFSGDEAEHRNEMRCRAAAAAFAFVLPEDAELLDFRSESHPSSCVHPDQSLIFQHHVAVGHAGEVIAHGAVQADLKEAAAGLPADLARMREIEPEHYLQHAHGAGVGSAHLWIVVEVAVKIFSQFEVLCPSLWAVLDQRLGTKPHVVGGLNARPRDESFAAFNHVAHLAVRDGANGEVTSALVRKRPVLLFDALGGLRPDANLAS
jgi:hypothetical protein